MGLYTHEETSQPVVLDSLCRYPDGVTMDLIWRQIADGRNFQAANKLKATYLWDPLHRYMHRVIAHSIAGHKVTSGGVIINDVFCLYCLITRTQCNMAYMLADYLTSNMGTRQSGHICGGRM